MAPQIQKLDREAAKLEPEAHFKQPESLLEEIGLTLGEKLSALERWAHQVDRRLASGNEGMPTRGTEPHDAELLRRIELTKQELEDQSQSR